MTTKGIKTIDKIVRSLHQNRYTQLRDLQFSKDKAYKMKEEEIAYAVAQIEQLITEARIEEMELAHKAWLTSSLVKYMEDRLKELKSDE